MRKVKITSWFPKDGSGWKFGGENDETVEAYVVGDPEEHEYSWYRLLFPLEEVARNVREHTGEDYSEEDVRENFSNNVYTEDGVTGLRISVSPVHVKEV